MTKHNTFWGVMYSLIWVVLAFVAGASMNGCAVTPHAPIVKNFKPWTLPTKCKMMDKVVTPSFMVAVQQGCIAKNVTSVAILFRVPYQKYMSKEVAKTVRGLLGEVVLDLVTMGRSGGKSFFLMVVRQ
jgi:hypothetical protein